MPLKEMFYALKGQFLRSHSLSSFVITLPLFISFYSQVSPRHSQRLAKRTSRLAELPRYSSFSHPPPPPPAAALPPPAAARFAHPRPLGDSPSFPDTSAELLAEARATFARIEKEAGVIYD